MPAPDQHTPAVSAALFNSLESEEFLYALMQGVKLYVTFDNFIVFAYRQGFAADLVFTNLEMDYLRHQMTPYTSGLYLLDPFYVADMSGGRRGLLRLDEVAPEQFRESEFYLNFYAALPVIDELHYVVGLTAGRSVHVFLERETSRFEVDEIASLRALEPLVLSSVRRHWIWRDKSPQQAARSPIQSAGGIDGVIRNMRPGQLTRREVEVVGLSLRGYSSKLIADQLDISEGTVTNHKRNVYEKLGVHSQTQLFSLFLRTLAGEDGAVI